MEYFFSTQPTSYSPPPSPNSNTHDDVVEPPKDLNKVAKRTTTSSRKGGGVKLSTDPQSVAARERRHRISNRFKILQSLVPGGSKMDTVSMLEEAINYVKFLQAQLLLHQAIVMDIDDHDHHHRDLHDPRVSSDLDSYRYRRHDDDVDYEDDDLPPRHDHYLERSTTMDRSFPELRITEYSVPPPEYSWFRGGVDEEEANGAYTSSSYGGYL